MSNIDKERYTEIAMELTISLILYAYTFAIVVFYL